MQQPDTGQSAESPVGRSLTKWIQSSSSPGVTRRLMMDTGMSETGGFEVETESFCVVCVQGNEVVHCPFWEIEPHQKAELIAKTVARAAETFGQADFDVFVIEIRV